MERSEHSRVLGRERELAEIHRFVATSGGPRALVLEGSAGIGKTTLWQAGSVPRTPGVPRARRSSRRGRSDAVVLGARRSVRSGVRGGGGPTCPNRNEGPSTPHCCASKRRVGARPACDLTRHARRRARARRPLAGLIALDDVQWLDTSTAYVVAFVLRRLADEPVRMIASLRHGAAHPGAARARRGDRTRQGRPAHGGAARRGGDRQDAASSARRRPESPGDPSDPFGLAGQPAVRPGDRSRDRRAGHAAGVGGAVSRAGGSPAVAHGARRRPARRRRGAPADDRQPHAPDRRHGARRGGTFRRSSQGPGRRRGRGCHRTIGERVRFSHPLLGSTVYAAASPSDSAVAPSAARGTCRRPRGACAALGARVGRSRCRRWRPNSTRRRGTLDRAAPRTRRLSSRSSRSGERPSRTPNGCACEGSRPPGITSTPAMLPRRSSYSGSPGRKRRPAPREPRSSTARPR